MKNTLLIALLSLTTTTAMADDLRPLRNAPPAFQAECASCHIAFPPQLLGADDWRRVMRSLDKHYGDNASLDPKTSQILEDFLSRNAGRSGIGRTANPNELPRITQSTWFQREHREVGAADWKHAKVKTPANCAACHTQAATGSYREREIVMPNGRRRDD